MGKAKRTKPEERKNLPVNLVTKVLTESGYRCAVPTCRNILALDMHHIWEVNVGGPDEPWNLIALCPTCHALYHRGTIKEASIFAWKSMLMTLGRAFDLDTIDKLLFLHTIPEQLLVMSGDGVLQFSRLVGAGLVVFSLKANNNWTLVTYQVQLTEKGRLLVTAWKSGDSKELGQVLSPPEPIAPYTREFTEEDWIEHEGVFIFGVPVSVHRRGFAPSFKVYTKTDEGLKEGLSATVTIPANSVTIQTEKPFAGTIEIH
ncbi:HNH endonuclease signature motif containing protein [Urbifossiella limnaea]|uniref:HNH endonuclease n=1 Tax=Urbifossiella limnaea TaxID=2528023 RepID=A0A517XL05_9BACT|nr:HNH endonuclease signature motif containing protein [Urbifossiella limnaea]QDU18191.1 HNH endonuclease [Urbifossiella limnaea]